MNRRQANPLLDPLRYATTQRPTGAPVTRAAAERSLRGYDYVIVGAGAAGCVLASKLSEDREVSVLLLEAGGDNAKILETKIPLMFGKLFHGEHDWDYYTTEQPCLASRRLYWPRGRLLGGSTSMNAMMYHHCSGSDFDEWATKYGCEGWAYRDLAPYFRSMEKFTPNPSRPAIDLEHRGSQGLWQTGYSWLSDICGDGFVNSCVEAGIKANSDVNTTAGSLGVTRFQTFIDPQGRRSSMATAFLSPEVLRRPNLFVACYAQVTRILFDTLRTDAAPTAMGVEFQTKRDGPRFEVHAKQEVILCGGAVNTPQILMLSGIGSREDLFAHGVPIVRELGAVGKNLKDHLCPTGVLCKAKPGTTLDYLGDPIKALPALARWMLFGTGPLTSNVAESAAFIRATDGGIVPDGQSKNRVNTSGSLAPDLEIIAAPMAFIHHGEERARSGESVFGLAPISLRPFSAGTVSLRSRDAYDHPIIDPKYLSDKDGDDLKLLQTGVRICLKISRSPALQKYLEPVPTNDDPTSYWWPYSSSDIDAISDEDLIPWMKEKAYTLYHPVGTARMGPSPSDSVVDTECKVHGVNGLRIMDASIFPEQISGHPTAPIGAMAYKLSDLIRKGRQ